MNMRVARCVTLYACLLALFSLGGATLSKKDKKRKKEKDPNLVYHNFMEGGGGGGERVGGALDWEVISVATCAPIQFK